MKAASHGKCGNGPGFRYSAQPSTSLTLHLSTEVIRVNPGQKNQFAPSPIHESKNPQPPFPLATHHSSLITHHSLPITHHSSLPPIQAYSSLFKEGGGPVSPHFIQPATPDSGRFWPVVTRTVTSVLTPQFPVWYKSVNHN